MLINKRAGPLVALVLGVLLCGKHLHAQKPNPADLIMEKAIKKAQENNRLKHNQFTYQQKETVDEYDLKGNRRSRKQKTTDITRSDGNIAGVKLDIYEALGTRYLFKMSPSNSIVAEGLSLQAVVEFSPKPELKIAGIEDNFINHLSGKVYVNLEDYSIPKIEASAAQPFSFRYWGWGVFPLTITINKFTLEFNQVKFQDIWVEQTIRANAIFDTIARDGARIYLYEYFNFKHK